MRILKGALFLVIATAFVACSGLGKMQKKAEDVSYKVTPTPLEVKGDRVSVNVAGIFPEKYFDRKTTLEVTPRLTFANGKADFKSVTMQGERVAGNNKQINYKEGGRFNYDDVVPYQEGMEWSELVVVAKGTRGTKTKDFDPIKIGVGVITTPYLMQDDDKLILAPHGFERITRHQIKTIINYLQNSSSVRGSELRDDDVVALKAFAKEVNKLGNITVQGVTIESHASPEGELRLNERLADNRGNAAKRIVAQILRANKISDKQEGFYNLLPKGEDWLGFKELMQGSDIEDRDLILRILTMYEDLTKREKEIRNLAKTYTEVADKILPQLRRSQIVMTYEVVGYTDEELVEMAKNNALDLNEQELLYAATLFDNATDRIEVYKKAVDQYSNSEAAANNLGYELFKNGQMEEAKAAFEKSLAISENVYANNNLGVVFRREGNREEAANLLSKATSLGAEVSYNLGLVNIQNGDYGDAVNNVGDIQSFNSALAKHLNRDQEGAAQVLETMTDDAMAQYLLAIVAAKENNETKMVDALTKAIALDASLKAKAAKDMAFFYFFENTSFQGVVK